jgi:hypothetical protein
MVRFRGSRAGVISGAFWITRTTLRGVSVSDPVWIATPADDPRLEGDVELGPPESEMEFVHVMEASLFRKRHSMCMW